MTRYAPASWLTIPSHFGKRPDVAVRTPRTLGEQAQADAAIAQHEAALALRDRLAARRASISDLAALLGENAEHLRRKLTGNASASLQDIATWKRIADIDLEAARTAAAPTSAPSGPYRKSPQPVTYWPHPNTRVAS